MLGAEAGGLVLKFQTGEITEHYIYRDLSRLTRDPNNKKILAQISDDEFRHYNLFKKISGRDVRPDRLKQWFYIAVSTIFGVTFGLKLMEGGESRAQSGYQTLLKDLPDIEAVIKDENGHENQLIGMISEQKLNYIGAMILGLNDALVEMTGTLAGLTFALENTRVVGVAGLITGIAAALSMASSEYLSTKAEPQGKSPFRAAFYTGLAYFVTVFLLVLPYFLLTNIFLCLTVAVAVTILLILFFNVYISVVKGVSFKSRFLEMLVVCLGVSALSFIIGLLVRFCLKIDI